jgi:hypothetical protein
MLPEVAADPDAIPLYRYPGLAVISVISYVLLYG